MPELEQRFELPAERTIVRANLWLIRSEPNSSNSKQNKTDLTYITMALYLVIQHIGFTTELT